MDSEGGTEAVREVQGKGMEPIWDARGAAIRLYRISKIADREERNRRLDQEIRQTLEQIGADEGGAGGKV